MSVAILVLVGLPGAGKSAVARGVADAWGAEFRDTDDEFAVSAGCTAAEFLRTNGERAFREEEFRVLQRCLAGDTVVATGGGIVTTEKARDALRSEQTIWLDCDDEVLVERVRDGDRPLLGDDPVAAIARLRSERSPSYLDVSRTRLDASGSVGEVVARVLSVATGPQR